MNVMEFSQLLLRTAFSCMSCDGEIAQEEVNLIKKISSENGFMREFDINVELEKLLEEIKIKGKSFLKEYLLLLEENTLSKEQSFSVLQLALDTIKADNKIEYSEIKFFKIIRSNLESITDKEILEHVEGIDETYLAQDIKSSNFQLYEDYFNNIELSDLVRNDLKN